MEDRSKEWTVPRLWNQGGYDAVYEEKSIDNTGIPTVRIRIVQITRAEKHSFKYQYFASLLRNLTESLQSHRVQPVEVYFVVPIKELSIFKPKIDTLRFQKDILEVAGLKVDTSSVVVEAVGLKHKELCAYENLKQQETKRIEKLLKHAVANQCMG
ncbi:hypothetical protein CCR75_006254 [Bremia lactucae]|uniref:Uncharacterized protein n=1 Tax=Bremia lactucae TaxID=4779 RepID=A0A976IFI3_BRELC|nr:hypothetical protein CCR75_006254 [Bremia lactucae]